MFNTRHLLLKARIAVSVADEGFVFAHAYYSCHICTCMCPLLSACLNGRVAGAPVSQWSC